MAEDLASPDAFAATIRQAQIHSRQSDDSVDGTVLAIKVRDLELAPPGQGLAESDLRRSIYHNGQDEDLGDDTEEACDSAKGLKQSDSQELDEETMKKAVKKEKRKRNWKTFLLFLLLGFLIGSAVILLIWLILLS